MSAAVVGFFLFWAILFEVGLRIAWHNPFAEELPERVLVVPAHHGLSDFRQVNRARIAPEDPVVTLRTDERGYILPSRQHERPDATIAFLGASIVEAYAVKEELRFPALVSTLLSRDGLAVNTLNAGRSGNTMQEILNLLINQLVVDGADVAVLMQVSNDEGLLRTRGSYRSRMGEHMGLAGTLRWPLQWASSHSHLAGLARKAATIASDPAPDRPGRRYDPDPDGGVRLPLTLYTARVESFIHVARAFGIEPVLMTEPRRAVQREHARFNQAVRDVGAAAGVLVIDLDAHVRETVEGWDQPLTVFYDIAHITDAGSRIYADYIAARLRESGLLEKIAAARRPDGFR